MKIRITDIPPEGRELNFAVDLSRINERLFASCQRADGVPQTPSYNFSDAPNAAVSLSSDGRTVFVQGHAEGRYTTTCSRCAEITDQVVSTRFRMVFKPHSERSRPDEEVEDLELGFYDGKELNVSPVIEEALLLALPFTVICRSDCRGLCPQCGTNLNTERCGCVKSGGGDERFAALRGLKVQ